MPTIHDVAAAAGVSTATVSRALRMHPTVSAGTRERVFAAAARLGYIVSPQASALSSGRSGTIGIVVPFVGRWFFGRLIDSIDPVLRAAGYNILLYSIGDPEARRHFFTERPYQGRVEALIILTLPLSDAEISMLQTSRVPIVTIGAKAGFPSISIDDNVGATTAVNHLLYLGHRNIGLISGGTDTLFHFSAPRDRRTAYQNTLAAASITFLPSWEANGDFTQEGGYHAMCAILRSHVPVSAVVALSDDMAFGALTALQDRHLTVDDISIIGFDDHDLAKLVGLTTIHQPVVRQGQRAAETLLKVLKDDSKSEVQSTEFPTRLMVRKTTSRFSGRTDNDFRQHRRGSA